MSPTTTMAYPGAAEVQELLATLQALLADELAALGSHDAARLEAIVARKTALVATLETATRHLATLPAAAAEWAALRPLATACANANRVNGGAIALNRGLVERLVALTRCPAGPATYTAHGRLTPGAAAATSPRCEPD